MARHLNLDFALFGAIHFDGWRAAKMAIDCLQIRFVHRLAPGEGGKDLGQFLILERTLSL